MYTVTCLTLSNILWTTKWLLWHGHAWSGLGSCSPCFVSINISGQTFQGHADSRSFIRSYTRCSPSKTCRLTSPLIVIHNGLIRNVFSQVFQEQTILSQHPLDLIYVSAPHKKTLSQQKTLQWSLASLVEYSQSSWLSTSFWWLQCWFCWGT